MMKKLIFTLVLVLTLASCKKEEPLEFGTGLKYDEKKYLAVEEKAHLVKRDYDNLPSAVNLSYYTPTPENQGKYGTCVGWATTYAAMTTCESIMQDRDNPYYSQQQAFSPYYLYRGCNSNDRTGEGMYPEDALEYLKLKGVPKRNASELRTDYGAFEMSSYDGAELYKIGSYARITSSTYTWQENTRRIKKSLSEKKPVVISFFDYGVRSFQEAMGVSDWYVTSPYDGGGHAMVIVGYDDNHNNPNGIEPGAFLFQNSWGTDWGCNGYIWVNYQDAATYIYQAFEMSPSILQVYNNEPEPEPIKPEPQPKPQPKPVEKKVQIFEGDFSLPLFKGSKTSDDLMEVIYKNGCYETTKSYHFPQKFQLFMTNKKPCYVYAFASDSKTEKAVRIFPPENTSALLDYTENTVVYPAEDKSIQLDDVSGTDYLVVLYSLEELDLVPIMQKFEERLNSSAGSEKDLSSIVRDCIDDDALLPKNDISFLKNKISFSVKTKKPKNNKILPVLIKINHK